MFPARRARRRSDARPDCGIFLDDVTVSAQALRSCASADAASSSRTRAASTGTFVNRSASSRRSSRTATSCRSASTAHLLRALMATASKARCSRSGRLRDAQGRLSRTSRSRRSATSKTRDCCAAADARAATGLFSEEDVERLETILRLQRDEFLPLRVIRQELRRPAARDAAPARARCRRRELDLDELCERAAIDVRLPGARGLRAASPRATGGKSLLGSSKPNRAACGGSPVGIARAPACVPQRGRPRGGLIEQVVGRRCASRNPSARAGRRT
jgi:hypothetical protein